MTRLVIDEISMVRADLIDAADSRLREARGSSAPFGGVQVVMVGDFLQLPPVVEEEARPVLAGLGYRSPYAFSAHVLSRMPVQPVFLKKVYRQKEQEFVEILRHVRLGQQVEGALATLNERCVRDHRREVTPLILTPTKGAAAQYNQEGLAALRGPPRIFKAKIEGELRIDKDRLPVPEELELREGARVMAAKNDAGRRWVNGSLGTVTRIKGEDVYVRFDRSGEEYLVPRASWGQVQQQWDNENSRIRERVLASYEQVPLNHAWATTVHKSQGLTLDDVRLDLGNGAFAPGQVYVALSRCTTLEGLSLARPLRAADIMSDPMLLDFLKWLERLQE